MKENNDLENKEDNLDYEDENNNEDMNYNYSSGVVITDVNIPFGDLVLFLEKHLYGYFLLSIFLLEFLQ